LEQRCYNYVHLCEKLGIDWKPTTEMFEAVKSKSLAKDFWPVLDAESGARFWSMVIDPRIDTEKLERQFGALGNGGSTSE